MTRRQSSSGAAHPGRYDPVPARARARGQSSVEYLVVLALLSLALVVGPDSPLEQVFRAFAQRYQQFTYAISRP